MAVSIGINPLIKKGGIAKWWGKRKSMIVLALETDDCT
jgi:hypothetical protein